jgi:ribosome-binding protein aMBF1 (putative translation factor)
MKVETKEETMNRRSDMEREAHGEAGRLACLFASEVMTEMERQKLSRLDLAKMMGVSKQVIYSHLDGEKPITMLTMGKFAAALGIYFELRIKKGVKRDGASRRSRRPG